MSGHTVIALHDVPDALGDYAGEMRYLTGPLGTRQVALTHRRMPAGTGGKGSYGHHHRTQEEVYLVTRGRLEFKLGDEVVEVGAGSAVRVAPEVVRSVWNEGPADAELFIFSTRIEDLRADVVLKQNFWPAG